MSSLGKLQDQSKASFRGAQDKVPKFNYIQFSGVARFSAWIFTDSGTQQFRYPVREYRKFLPNSSLPREDMDYSRSIVYTR